MADSIHSGFVLNTYSYTLRGPLEAQLSSFAESGFCELELMMYPGHLWPLDMSQEQRRELRKRLADLQLSVRTVNQPNIDINVANAHFIGEDLEAGFARVAPRLHTIHLSDTFRSLYRHDPVGQGDVDFAAALAAARSSGHRRRAVLEIISSDPDRDIDASARTLSGEGWSTLAA